MLTPTRPSRRVHITGATLTLLAGAYAVEDAAMEHRDPYLRELGEPTYLVIDPRVKAQPGPDRLTLQTTHIYRPNHFCYARDWQAEGLGPSGQGEGQASKGWWGRGE